MMSFSNGNIHKIALEFDVSPVKSEGVQDSGANCGDYGSPLKLIDSITISLLSIEIAKDFQLHDKCH